MPSTHTAPAPPASRRLTRTDLPRLFVVAQCLDDQWVPAPLLNDMVRKGDSFADVARVRNRYIRAEYRRALVNARQMVVNRAYLYNTPVVLQDYQKAGEQRDAFVRLVEAGTIAPFLYNERTPTDEPQQAYDPAGFKAWTGLCEEAEPVCVRLSWNDEENQAAIDRHLTRRFNQFVSSAYDLDPAVMAQDLGLPADAAPRLKKKLAEIAAYKTTLDGPIKRTHVYEQFINVDGSRPAEGRFDPAKPFAAQIKQLVDLNYNVNLPDALEGFALTPAGALPRTVLQEHQESRKRKYTAEELVRIIQNFVFSTVQEALVVKSMGDLTLRDVLQVRASDEWLDYVTTLDLLLEAPEKFSDPDTGALAVYRKYAALAQRMTDVVLERRTGRIRSLMTSWQPGIEFVIDAAGKWVSLRYGPAGEVLVSAGGQIAKHFVGEAVPLVGRLIIRGWNFARGASDVAMSVDVFSGRIDRAREQLEEMERQLRPRALQAAHARLDANINVGVPDAEAA